MRKEEPSQGSLSRMGLAKSRSTQASSIAAVNSTQYASLADFRITSREAKEQAWQAQVAAQEARALPIQPPNMNMMVLNCWYSHDTV